jgi:hypothetical protein
MANTSPPSPAQDLRAASRRIRMQSKKIIDGAKHTVALAERALIRSRELTRRLAGRLDRPRN